MNILSIIWGTCSTAALMVNGEIVACVSEERFTRKKNDEAYPKMAIEYVLKQAGLSADKVDLFVYAGKRFDATAVLLRKYSNWSVQDRMREQREYWYPKLYGKQDVSALDVFKDKLDTDQYPGRWDDVSRFLRNGGNQQSDEFFQDFRCRVLADHLGISQEKVVFAEHHRAHAFYAYFASPFRGEKTLVLTADAFGDNTNASVSVVENGKIEKISDYDKLSIARLYRYITLLLGMKPDEHEYKVMGLAAYSKSDYIGAPLQVFRNTMFVDGMGFGYRQVPPDMFYYFRDKLEGFRFDAISGALQEYTSNILVEWARNCLVATGARKLCFGGGVGMNVKAMMDIAGLTELEAMFVCPAPSDESLAIGAAYVVMHDQCVRDGLNPDQVLRPLKDAYLGPGIDQGEVKKIIHGLSGDSQYDIRERANPDYIAQAIAGGKIVGRCSGRSEFGARALGNRSILADPRNIDVIKRINEKVKSRDFWMPFAPSIIEKRAPDYLINPKNIVAPYMTIAFNTTPVASQDLRAALHQADLTCRPQIVHRTANPEYHELISAFERLTGVGGVLNTSFNIHGEPIIQSASDALDVLERSGLDAVIIGDYFVERKARLMTTAPGPRTSRAGGRALRPRELNQGV